MNVHELDESILETLERELEITLEGCRHLETKSSQIEVCSSSKSASNDHFHVFTPDLGAEKWAQETRENQRRTEQQNFTVGAESKGDLTEGQTEPPVD